MDKWLQSVGLGERAAAFRKHGITFDQLSDLNDGDLRELGLTIGERKRFRRALASLAAAGVVAAESAVALPTGAAPLEPRRAERRPLTMMFVDLVNSSGLSERLEPEDLLEVIRAYRAFAGAAIGRFGGHVARFVGDGILAYFCYPVATENDPERAVRSALEIARGIGGLETPAGAPLAVRIGIATGRVIVSDVLAGGRPDMSSIIGSSPNLAARLQNFATSGGIVVAEETFVRVAGLFLCEELGKCEVRGFVQRHNAWRVIAEAPRRRREGATLPRRMTPLIGRQAELGVLAERWGRARAGEGGSVLVVGEPGIGKSRLVEHFLAGNIGADAPVLRFAANVLDEDSALHPVITALRIAAGLRADDPRRLRLARLEAILGGDAAARRAALPVIGELIGIASDDPAIRAATPAQLRERILSVLTEQLLLLSKQQPLCLLIEDLQWLDPTSRELLSRITASIPGHAAMILLTVREGFEAPWTADRATTVLRLAPLSPGAVGEMVRCLFAGHEIPAHLGRVIARRTDGVPLFVEEVARSLLGLASLDGLTDDSIDEPDPAIPASLHDSLMGRLDKSGVAKQVAQIAAVIGRSARRDVLADVAALAADALEQPLAALVEAGVLVRAVADGGDRYAFTHALLRDAAYDSVLRDERRTLHLRVARALGAHDPQTVADRPGLLAMHLTEGQQAEEAAPYWLEAARRSLARSALTEATRLLRHGLEALENLPPAPGVLDHRLALSALLGPALISLKGPASAEAQELYGQALALSEQVPEHPSRFPLHWGWWRVSRDFGVKKQRAETMLARAAARNDPELLLQAHHCNWAAHFESGDFARCCVHIGLGLGIYRGGDFRHHARLYGNHDPLVCGLGALSQIEWMQGRPVSGLAHEQESKLWARQLDHVGTRVHSFDVQILHRSHRRDHQEVYDLAAELIALTGDHGLADHRAKGLIFRGWAVAMRDDPAGGLRALEEGLARQREIGTLEDFPVYVALHAEALARAGHPDRAVEALRRERAVFDRIGLRFWMPEVLRLLAEVMLQADPAGAEAARALLRESAALAEAQGAAMLGLRTAMTAARLEARLDGPEAAARRVEHALACIAEDDGGAEIAEARAMAAAWGAGERGLLPWSAAR